jgi:integrase
MQGSMSIERMCQLAEVSRAGFYRVYSLLRARHERACRAEDGWVFPSAAACGHFDGNAAKEQHKKALDKSRVNYFVPYVLRHTALTNLGKQATGVVIGIRRATHARDQIRPGRGCRLAMACSNAAIASRLVSVRSRAQPTTLRENPIPIMNGRFI